MSDETQKKLDSNEYVSLETAIISKAVQMRKRLDKNFISLMLQMTPEFMQSIVEKIERTDFAASGNYYFRDKFNNVFNFETRDEMEFFKLLYNNLGKPTYFRTSVKTKKDGSKKTSRVESKVYGRDRWSDAVEFFKHTIELYDKARKDSEHIEEAETAVSV